MHTRVSSDSRGSPGELIDAAHGAGLDWIALTEHVRSASQAPSRGLVEGVCLIPGYEVSAAGGSILALGVVERPARFRGAAETVREIHAEGGIAILGHLERSGLAAPEPYLEAGLDGIERVNLHANAGASRVGLALRQLLLPAPLALRTLVRTPLENLRLWAALPPAHTIVAGADAHAKFRLFGRFGGTFDRYRDLFRIVTTHVMATDASEPAILEALRRGRSYVAFEALAPVERFRFDLVRGSARMSPHPAPANSATQREEKAAPSDSARRFGRRARTPHPRGSPGPAGGGEPAQAGKGSPCGASKLDRPRLEGPGPPGAAPRPRAPIPRWHAVPLPTPVAPHRTRSPRLQARDPDPAPNSASGGANEALIWPILAVETFGRARSRGVCPLRKRRSGAGPSRRSVPIAGRCGPGLVSKLFLIKQASQASLLRGRRE